MSRNARTARLAEHVRFQELQAADHAAALLAELDSTLARVRKLFDACDRWLADPDDPSRYDLNPRAEEIIVHHTIVGPDGAARRAATRACGGFPGENPGRTG